MNPRDVLAGTTPRTDRMRTLAQQAREYDRRGDVTMRQQAADCWRFLATTADANRAPRYLTWTGR